METKESETEIETETIIDPEPTIKHIAISGGGITGFSYYGILKETQRLGIWQYDNIKSIYGTSVGAIVGVILCLKYDWETLDDYLIKRPWSNVFKFNMYSIIDSYQKRGIFDMKPIEETLSPLFKGKDISIDVTMKEFYELTNIELHVFSTELNSYELVDFSYKTHPDWKIVEVVYCSACLPVMFAPYLKDDKCYCDGGLIENYPIDACIKTGVDCTEILGIRKINKTEINTTDEKSSLMDYLLIVLNNYSKKMLVLNNISKLRYEYIVESPASSLYNIHYVLNDVEERIKLINKGIELVSAPSSQCNLVQHSADKLL
jgi:predicted acylesterase/phospholipase RssA